MFSCKKQIEKVLDIEGDSCPVRKDNNYLHGIRCKNCQSLNYFNIQYVITARAFIKSICLRCYYCKCGLSIYP